MTARQEKFRWQQLFHRTTVPLFLLDRERRLLFVNHAFAEMTGFALEELRGRVCRHHLSAAAGTEEALLSALAPPLETLEGKSAALRRPAADQSSRSWNIDFFPLGEAGELLAVLGRITPTGNPPAEETATLPTRLLTLRDRGRQWHRLDNLRSETPALGRVLEQVRLAIRTTEPVWIGGEAGVGKHWLARVIHNESQARDRCFIALDCRRLPSAWVSRVMRGGGRSGPAGTIYLQEPQFLAREIQAQFVESFHARREDRGGQEKSPRVLIGSTLLADSSPPESNLLEEFRCAFSALSIHLPPLRQRRADLRGLAERLLPRAASAAGKAITGLSAEVWDVILAAPWPGNLRELFAVLRQACQRAAGPVVQANELPWYLRDAPSTPEKPLALDGLLEQVERRLVLLALERSRQNKSRAAEMLSIWRGRLIRRLKDLGIDDDATSSSADT